MSRHNSQKIRIYYSESNSSVISCHNLINDIITLNVPTWVWQTQSTYYFRIVTSMSVTQGLIIQIPPMHFWILPSGLIYLITSFPLPNPTTTNLATCTHITDHSALGPNFQKDFPQKLMFVYFFMSLILQNKFLRHCS